MRLKLIFILISIPIIMEAQNVDKTIVWKSSYVNTTEFTTIKATDNIIVNGQITGEGLGKLLNVKYKLEINTRWEIQSLLIGFQSDTSFTISLHKDKAGQWIDDKGRIQTQLAQCTDIDISLTPFANTLPINRLDLPGGASKEIVVIYFDLPNNQYKPVKQRYTNLDNGIYKYENLESGFASMLEVDKEGIVLNYPGIWHRVFPENEKNQD